MMVLVSSFSSPTFSRPRPRLRAASWWCQEQSSVVRAQVPKTTMILGPTSKWMSVVVVSMIHNAPITLASYSIESRVEIDHTLSCIMATVHFSCSNIGKKASFKKYQLSSCRKASLGTTINYPSMNIAIIGPRTKRAFWNTTWPRARSI
jgi:hypothetical protein